MTQKKKSSFEEHIYKWKKFGGLGCSLMSIEDIDPKDMAKIIAEAFSHYALIGPNDEDKRDAAYISTLHKYGVMCPHPQNKRFYNGSISSDKPLVDYNWYTCELCDCAVFNEHYFRRIREQEEKNSVIG